MTSLRDYQARAVERVLDRVRAGSDSVLLIARTREIPTPKVVEDEQP